MSVLKVRFKSTKDLNAVLLCADYNATCDKWIDDEFMWNYLFHLTCVTDTEELILAWKKYAIC